MALPSDMLWILAFFACQDPADLDGDGVPAARDCDDEDPEVGAGSLAWADLDGDGYGQDTLWAQACPGAPGWAQQAGDCDDADPTEHPGHALCDCGRGDEASVDWYADTDGDGFGEGSPVSQSCGGADTLASSAGDCAPLDPQIHPGAEETWYDGEDQNCDGASDYDADQDGHDSLDYGGRDCDDQAPATHPDAGEICDVEGADEDCDGLINGDDPSARGWTSWFVDEDGDGYGTGSSVLACAPSSGFALLGGDCEDTTASINPGQAEVCGDGVENDCQAVLGECGVHGTGALGTADLVGLEGANGGYVPGGDIEGSGEEVVLVGAPLRYESGDYKGSVHLLRAGAKTAETLVYSESAYSTIGSSLHVGDIDGDGQSDLVVGATTHLEAGVYASRVFLGLGPISADTVLDDWPSVQGSSFGTLAIVPDYFAAVESSGRLGDQSQGVVYLFGPDPGPQATTQDAEGGLYWDDVEDWSGYTQVLGQGLRVCDLDASGQTGLLLTVRTSGPEGSGVIWTPEVEDGFTPLTTADLLVVAEAGIPVSASELFCGDVSGDGYPEVILRGQDRSSALLVFEGDEMGQSVSAPWLRLDGTSATGSALYVALDQDLDGEGSIDVLLGDLGQPNGAVEVLYGPLEGGTVELGENRYNGSLDIGLGYGVAALDSGFWAGTKNNNGALWIPAGPGI